MKKLKLLSIMLVAVLMLSACQAGVANETPPQEVEAASSGVIENTATEEAVTEVSSETVVSENVAAEEASEDNTEETSENSSEEVAKFPVRDEKIPPYELTLRDGTTVKLDQFEGKVVLLTFFTTW